MKKVLLSAIAFAAMQTPSIYAAPSSSEVMNEFAPLIKRVRGAIRYQIENGKGCLPWSSLAVDPKTDQSDKATVDFAFTAEQVKQIGNPSAQVIATLVKPVATKGLFTMAAIGTCETDASISDTQSPNVISLMLERRDGAAIKMRFPFQQGSDGKVSYIENKTSIGSSEPLVFGSSTWLATQQSIAITEQGQSFEITVPVAKLALRLPKSDFRREPPPSVGGATASPRYFLLSDTKRGIRLSGWFEPSSQFTGVKDSSPSVLKGKTLTHQNIEYKKTGDWDTVQFDQVEESLSVNMASVNAHLGMVCTTTADAATACCYFR